MPEGGSSSGFLQFAETCRLVESTSSKLSKIDIVANYFSSFPTKISK